MGAGYAMSIILNYLRNDEWQYWKDEWETSLDRMPDKTNDQENHKEEIGKLLRKRLLDFSGTGNWLNGIARTIHNNMIHDVNMHKKIQFNLSSKTRHYFQFKNKAYNLKTGLLEDRTRDMYVTASGILSYDYPENENDSDYQKEMDTIHKMMAQSQPEPKFLEALKSWFGYCLTGETRAKKFMLNVGKTAGNSKSFYLEMFCICFSIYGKMLEKKALNMGNDTGFNKAFASCANCPLRLVYLEELSDRIDIERIKILTHHVLSVLPLYQEQINMLIQFKLAIAANKDLDTGGNNCNGFNRRALLLAWLTQYVDDPDDVDEQKHIYLKDETLLNLFDDDRFKIALFRIYAPYAKQFYTEGLKLPKECKNGFKQVQIDNDEWVDWMETFEKTNNKEDIISKAELLDEARRLKHNSKLGFAVVKNEFEKRGYVYESQMVKSKNKIKTKGFMTCVKRV
jgi:phage/plasmid-associated DNA primase